MYFEIVHLPGQRGISLRAQHAVEFFAAIWRCLDEDDCHAATAVSAFYQPMAAILNGSCEPHRNG